MGGRAIRTVSESVVVLPIRSFVTPGPSWWVPTTLRSNGRAAGQRERLSALS